MTSRRDPIPDWDASGFLPPFLDFSASEGGRSPYHVGLIDVVLRLGDTVDRRALLTGLLDYRAALHAASVREGFQWVNGSFVEDTMGHSRREPNDIDVVTFLHAPSGQPQAFEHLFRPQATKRKYGIDAYAVDLDTGDSSYLVRRVVYWNSLWSHGRSRQWKGYLEIDLSDNEDAAARVVLGGVAKQEVGE